MRIIGTIAVTAAMVVGAVAAAAAYASTQPTDTPARTHSMAMPMGMDMSGGARVAALPASQLAQARLATAKYANDLGAAQAGGYSILTQKIAGMGYHFINPSIKGFSVKKPPILVYERHGNRWQLGALEWVFPSKPATPPLKGATYGAFPAACHYKDGTFTPEPSQAACAPKSPQSGAAFNFWHPALVTMHVWIWYPNPAGLYASMNPLVPAFK
ncbi:MAG TPA: hypothetical protein VFD90_03055 [Gaiellales bacterium]|jgi:hypothetical protein|nr:hypothetical protein [Gaiellales bacterium]